MAQDEIGLGIARADLCRFLAACYYQPGPEFAEENLFGSMATAASRVHSDFAAGARRLGDAFMAQSSEDLLVDYTRLFLGPIDAMARPYGSVWLGGEQALMRDSTMEVQQLYQQGGFEIDENFRELPDHVAAELEFLYLLIFRAAEARASGSAEELAAMNALRQRLLVEHLGRWVGPFTSAIKDGAETLFYKELAELTERFVAAELRLVRA